jgi:hypothetical protein
MNFGPSDMRFASCDLLKIKENDQIAHLDFQTSDTQPAFFHHLSLGLLQEMDLHAMLVLHHIFFFGLEVLEQRVSGTVDRTEWTNSMTCHSPDLNHSDFY